MSSEIISGVLKAAIKKRPADDPLFYRLNIAGAVFDLTGIDKDMLHSFEEREKLLTEKEKVREINISLKGKDSHRFYSSDSTYANFSEVEIVAILEKWIEGINRIHTIILFRISKDTGWEAEHLIFLNGEKV